MDFDVRFLDLLFKGSELIIGLEFSTLIVLELESSKARDMIGTSKPRHMVGLRRVLECC